MVPDPFLFTNYFSGKEGSLKEKERGIRERGSASPTKKGSEEGYRVRKDRGV